MRNVLVIVATALAAAGAAFAQQQPAQPQPSPQPSRAEQHQGERDFVSAWPAHHIGDQRLGLGGDLRQQRFPGNLLRVGHSRAQEERPITVATPITAVAVTSTAGTTVQMSLTIFTGCPSWLFGDHASRGPQVSTRTRPAGQPFPGPGDGPERKTNVDAAGNNGGRLFCTLPVNRARTWRH